MVDLRYVFTRLRAENDYSAFAEDTGMVNTSCSNKTRSGNAAFKDNRWSGTSSGNKNYLHVLL